MSLAGRLRRLGFRLLWILSLTAFCGGAASAQSGESTYALQSGSPRLLLFSILKERPAGADGVTVQLFRKLGLDPRQGFDLSGATARLRPTIGFDPNINSGIPSDTLDLGPIVFAVPESAQARSGVVLGARLVSSVQSRIGFGQVVVIGASADIGLSPENRMWKSDAAAYICSQNHLRNWTFLDACMTGTMQRRELSLKEWLTPEIAITRVFGTRGGSHEVRLALGREIHKSYKKSYISATSKHAIGAVGLGSIGLYFGEHVGGVHSRLASFDAEMGRFIRGGFTSVGLTVFTEGGADLFGVERMDHGVSIHVSRAFREGFEVGLSLESRNSTISAYDGSSVGVSFRLTR